MAEHMIRAREPRGTADGMARITDPDRIAPFLGDAAHVTGGHADAMVVLEPGVLSAR